MYSTCAGWKRWTRRFGCWYTSGKLPLPLLV